MLNDLDDNDAGVVCPRCGGRGRIPYKTYRPEPYDDPTRSPYEKRSVKERIKDPVFVRRFARAWDDGVLASDLRSRFGLTLNGIAQLVRRLRLVPRRRR